MEMEAPRRSALDRSREPGTKKPRLAEEGERDRGPSAGVTSDRSRPYAQTRSAVGSSGGLGNPRFRASDREKEDRDEREDASRGGASYQQQQELVAQYRTALAELTFNSKPIITNLTIIAGENLHSAKSIVATVCANVLEVPSEQKLPSLYLLDSIVKNIGRDYVKYFAARLPEVFCKAYKLVDPSVHPSLRHLFGTWKGVFPASCLQVIEKELGFQPMINGSSGGTGTRSDTQTQRAPHSIHVNLKYLEARQRLQQSSRGKEMSSEDTDEVVTPGDDDERPIRTTSAANVKQWSELSNKKNVQLPRKEQPSDSTNEKKIYKVIREELPRQPEMRGVRTVDRTSELDDQAKESDDPNNFSFGFAGASKLTSYRRNGSDVDHFSDTYRDLGSVPKNNQASSNHPNRMNWAASKNWKVSEEEEYIWDDSGSRLADYEGAVNNRSSWSTPDDQDKPTSLRSHKWLPTEAEQVDSRLNKIDGFHRRATISGTENRLHFPREHEEHYLQPNNQETGSRVKKSAWPLPLFDAPPPTLAQDRAISRVSGQTENRPAQLGGALSTNDNSAVPRSGFQSTLSSSLSPSMDVLGSGGMLGQQRQLPLRSPSPTFPSIPSASIQQQRICGSIEHDYQPLLSSQIGQNSTHLAGQVNREKFAPFSSDSFSISSESSGQKVYTSLTSQPSQPSLSSFPELKHISSMHAVQNETSAYVPRDNELKGFSGKAHSSNPVDVSGQSNTNNLFGGVFKSELLPNKSASGLHIQPPLPSGPPPAQALTSSSSLPTSSTELNSSHGIIVPGLAPSLLVGLSPPLPPGPPPSASLLSSTSSQLANSANNISLNPLSNLLSALVAKGIITSAPTQLPTVSSSQMSKESTSQNSDPDGSTSTPPTSGKEHLVQRSTTTDNLIGTQFKTEIIREFHPTVIDSLLDELKLRCNACGLRFRHQEQFQNHLDWHSSNNSETSSSDKVCRRWYSNMVSWVSGDVEPQCGPVPLISLEDTSVELEDPMVIADESQCICLFCGEPFEDFYSVERNEWMYKGTVYLNSLEEGKVGGPIVHAKCVSGSEAYVGVTRFS